MNTIKFFRKANTMNIIVISVILLALLLAIGFWMGGASKTAFGGFFETLFG